MLHPIQLRNGAYLIGGRGDSCACRREVSEYLFWKNRRGEDRGENIRSPDRGDFQPRFAKDRELIGRVSISIFRGDRNGSKVKESLSQQLSLVGRSRYRQFKPHDGVLAFGPVRRPGPDSIAWTEASERSLGEVVGDTHRLTLDERL